MLSPSQVEAYHREGYLVLPAVFGPDEVAAMAAESDRLADHLVNASLALGELSPRLDIRVRDSGDKVLLKIQPLNDVSPLLRKVSEDERLVGPMRQLLGAEPLLLEEKLNGKELLTAEAAAGLEARPADDRFPFHTDYHYFWIDGYPPETLSSAITIDECTSEKGPLVVVPGSHLRDWPLGSTWPPYLADGLFDEGDQVELVVPAGTVVLFSSRLAHASRPNTTVEPRRLLIYSHYPATFEVAPDARNAHHRVAGQAHEARYEEALAAGYRPVPVRRAAVGTGS